MDIQEIQDTLRDANVYLSRLNSLIKNLQYAEDQVKFTAKETEAHISRVFDALLTAVKLTLASRRDELIRRTVKIKEQGLLPLRECKQVVEKKVVCTKNLIGHGNEILKTRRNDTKLNEFINRSSQLGSLPETPQLKEVPYLTFQYDSSIEKELIDICKDFGSVIHTPPVQIYCLKEQPGALIVKWKVSESDDHISDIQEFELQKAFGNVIAEKTLKENFRTCYKGPDNHYLVKELIVNQEYTFRVRCRFEGESEWSPWSFYEVGTTKLKPFCWNNNENFLLANENKIATPLNNSLLLFSNKSEFNVGYSVEFTFLECDNNLSGTYVGLFTSDCLDPNKLVDSESICVEANGNIYGSGTKKSTQFPPINKGSKICFACEMKTDDKLRVNIDSSGGRVTYDWPIDHHDIFFGAKFNSNKWKILID